MFIELTESRREPPEKDGAGTGQSPMPMDSGLIVHGDRDKCAIEEVLGAFRIELNIRTLHLRARFWRG